MAPDLALRHFVTALLPPGGFSVDALSAALEEGLGAGCSAAELRGCSVAELQRRTLQVCPASDVNLCKKGMLSFLQHLLQCFWPWCGGVNPAKRCITLAVKDQKHICFSSWRGVH